MQTVVTLPFAPQTTPIAHPFKIPPAGGATYIQANATLLENIADNSMGSLYVLYGSGAFRLGVIATLSSQTREKRH